MNRQFIVRSFMGLVMFLAIASLAFAQHGGGGHGGGGHGGGGHGGGGHGGGGHGGGGHGGGGHYGGGHGGGGHYGGGHGGGYGHYGGGHGGYGGHAGYGHYGGHGGYSHYGGGHGGYGHYGNHYYPHFDFYVSPWYGGYGYSSYNYPYYSPGSYYYGYNDVGTASARPALVEQDQPNSTPQVAAKPVTTSDGLDYQRRAEVAFRAGDFEGSVRLANHALVEMPRDGELLLFTSQTLFAVGDYRSAAMAIHQAAALLDEDKWGYVVENYRQFYRGRAYIEQMDRLNEFIQENPDAAYSYFLRGYQLGFLGHPESALSDLSKAVELESRDQLASQLIEHFGGAPPAVSDTNPVAGPAAESDGHGGHDHGSHEHG